MKNFLQKTFIIVAVLVLTVISVNTVSAADDVIMPPQLTLNGSATVTLTVGDTFVDAGATAIDTSTGKDRDISSLVQVTGHVDTTKTDTYELTYTVTGETGLSATPAIRTVVVQPANIAGLSSMINLAISTANAAPVGTTPGTYAQASVDTLKAAIDVAMNVQKNASATQSEVDGAKSTLFAAITAFESSVITAPAPVEPTPVTPETSSRSRSRGGSHIINRKVVTTAPVINGKVLGASTFKFDINLKQGDSNNDVMELQKFLAKAGYFTVTPTGYFGSVTLAAVKAFQGENGISPVSGFVGPLTRAVLNK